MAGRAWTMKEVCWLRKNYRQLGPARCAEILHRTSAAVVLQAMARHCGKRKLTAADVEATLRKLVTQGKSDAEIAPVLGLASGASAVRYWRRKLGLAAAPWRHKCPSYGKTGAAVVLREHGLKSLVELRWETERYRAAAAGWFGAESMAQVRVLESLRRGPATAREIIDRLGRRWCVGAYHGLRTMLRRLIDNGLVVARRGSRVSYSLVIRA